MPYLLRVRKNLIIRMVKSERTVQTRIRLLQSDQTAPVWSGSTLFVIQSASFRQIIAFKKPNCSILRTITVINLIVQMFRFLMAFNAATIVFWKVAFTVVLFRLEIVIARMSWFTYHFVRSCMRTLAHTVDCCFIKLTSRPVAKAYSVILKTVSIRRRDYILSFFFRKKSLPLPAF